MIWYVDSSREARPFYTEKAVVGPVISLINGLPTVTLGLSTEDIISLQKPTYQQLQIKGE